MEAAHSERTTDEEKRQRTLRERGLDFKDADKVFAGDVLTRQDPRDYDGELGFKRLGYLPAARSSSRGPSEMAPVESFR
jgi:uncharacterized DUF497 family protein